MVVAHLTNRPVTQVFLATLLSSDWESPEALAQVVSSWHREGENVIDLTGITLMAEQYPAWKLLAAQNVVMIDDVEIDEMLDDNERIGVQSLEMRSISILPLRVAGRSIGAIVLGSSEPYTHTERDVVVLTARSQNKPRCVWKPPVCSDERNAARVSLPHPRRSARSPAPFST